MKFELWMHNLIIINASFGRTIKHREIDRIHISSCLNKLVFRRSIKISEACGGLHSLNCGG
jgi:hypothetical protein